MLNGKPLEVVVGEILGRHGLSVAVAESCTGGLIGDLLTDVPGSSRYFYGGVVAYDDRLKTGLLRVPPELIVRHGAVSAECAMQMARSVRDLAGADIGLSVTGIAGPGGGTEEKPVGTVYIGLVTAASQHVERFCWNGDRVQNKRQSAEAALKLLIAHAGYVPAVAPQQTVIIGPDN